MTSAVRLVPVRWCRRLLLFMGTWPEPDRKGPEFASWRCCSFNLNTDALSASFWHTGQETASTNNSQRAEVGSHRPGHRDIAQLREDGRTNSFGLSPGTYVLKRFQDHLEAKVPSPTVPGRATRRCAYPGFRHRWHSPLLLYIIRPEGSKYANTICCFDAPIVVFECRACSRRQWRGENSLATWSHHWKPRLTGKAERAERLHVCRRRGSEAIHGTDS